MNRAKKRAELFSCELCNYKCFKKSDIDRHFSTRKHKMLHDATKNARHPCDGHEHTTNNIESKTAVKYICDCGNNYVHSSSYYRHKKKCTLINKDDLILSLLKQNADLIKNQHEMIAKLNHPQQINHINNCNNKTFNMHVFLTETCKNAMNIDDFVSNIKIELNDLENTGRIGYVEGITNIVVKNLNNMEQHLRPLHCSDYKREVMYIKENDEWTKEIDDKPILKRAINTISNENIKQIVRFKEKYPDCHKSNSYMNDLYLNIVNNSMNGSTQEEADKNVHKIISNLAKRVIIDKST